MNLLGSTRWRWCGGLAVLALAVSGCSKAGPAGGSTAGAPTIHAGPEAARIETLPVVAATPDTSVATALPPVPSMLNVAGNVVGDGVNITFEPTEGARDYRVFGLPPDADISAAAEGRVTVRNALYRCAGNRQTPTTTMDGAPQVQSGAIKTLVDGQDVGGYKRMVADATLGYVYVTPGEGRVPVYALGDSGPDGDNGCYFQRWGASRAKTYVTSAAERAALLSERARDDGIVFYVPAAARKGTTRTVFTSAAEKSRYYYVDGPEKAVRKNGRPAFEVLAQPGSFDTKPLMRVYYENGCGHSHDELVAGQSRFERARRQGDEQPMYDLRWAGLTGPTTLVVEALDQVCPHQGWWTPSVPGKAGSSSNVAYPPLVTLDDLRKTSPAGEVFLNGQGDAANRPRALARAFLRVKPAPLPDFDWFKGFAPGEPAAKFDEVPCGNPGGCWQQKSFRSLDMNLDFLFVDWFAYGQLFGEFWVAYADFAADTPGKVRITPTKKAALSADRFLHVTMEVDSFTSGRRYPVIMISDQDTPLEWNMVKGHTLTVQTFPDWPNNYLLEVCDHQRWDVNDHCPRFDMYQLAKPDDPTTVTGLSAGPEIGEHVGVDRSTRWDVFVSTKRAYLLLDGEAWGCADLPATGAPVAGPVTVTFSDVLYHSGADNNVFGFHKQHMQYMTRRHFDNIGFKSGGSAPPWNEARFPCVSRLRR